MAIPDQAFWSTPIAGARKTTGSECVAVTPEYPGYAVLPSCVFGHVGRHVWRSSCLEPNPVVQDTCQHTCQHLQRSWQTSALMCCVFLFSKIVPAKMFRTFRCPGFQRCFVGRETGPNASFPARGKTWSSRGTSMGCDTRARVATESASAAAQASRSVVCVFLSILGRASESS